MDDKKKDILDRLYREKHIDIDELVELSKELDMPAPIIELHIEPFTLPEDDINMDDYLLNLN